MQGYKMLCPTIPGLVLKKSGCNSQPCSSFFFLSVQEESFTALQMTDSAGWAIKAEIQSSDSEANGNTSAPNNSILKEAIFCCYPYVYK